MKAINSIIAGGDSLFYEKTIEAQSKRLGEVGGVSAVVSLPRERNRAAPANTVGVR